MEKEEIEESMKELKRVYNRGFSSGFYLGLPTADDFTKSDSGEAGEKKMIIGRIENYWNKIGVAHVKVFTGKLAVGDEIYIKGKTTGLIRAKIESMEINNKKVSKAEKGDVGIKLPLCRKNDEVYLIVKK